MAIGLLSYVLQISGSGSGIGLAAAVKDWACYRVPHLTGSIQKTMHFNNESAVSERILAELVLGKQSTRRRPDRAGGGGFPADIKSTGIIAVKNYQLLKVAQNSSIYDLNLKAFSSLFPDFHDQPRLLTRIDGKRGVLSNVGPVKLANYAPGSPPANVSSGLLNVGGECPHNLLTSAFGAEGSKHASVLRWLAGGHLAQNTTERADEVTDDRDMGVLVGAPSPSESEPTPAFSVRWQCPSARGKPARPGWVPGERGLGLGIGLPEDAQTSAHGPTQPGDKRGRFKLALQPSRRRILPRWV
ncbi:hypothetical protein B0T24DRAFT_597332 [Lasiosphaeria ovina]|uniref:Uncharacterized protein n=1 Tax=Lasiosphaeria ovina TaxID=92902 RepID=A0AAE0N0C3_9PEZI|nr:hypothetical protein B0T24DRAFT_597332 [Lasiosphaeria ovina]